MNLKEFCKQYYVPIELILQFVEAGILDDLNTKWKEDDLEDESVQRLESCLCLYSLDIDIKSIKTYISLEFSKEDTRMARTKILQKHRDHNLTNVHKTKKIMDCIDCIVLELKEDTL